MRSIVTDRRFRNCIVPVLVILGCIFIACKAYIEPNPEKMSPKQIVKLYNKLRDGDNIELLKQIIYFPPETTEEQKLVKVESIIAGPDEKIIMRMVGLRRKVKYQKYIDDSTAEVGTVASGVMFLGKHYPGNQVILRKEDSIWKYSHTMASLPIEILIERLKNNPENTDLYFHLARAYIPVNPARSHRYYLKYYELAPDGFWVDEDFGMLIKGYRKEYEQTEVYEKEMLATIDAMHVDDVLSKAIRYQRLCQLFMEKKDYAKASYYINKAEDVLKKDRSEYNYWKENLDKVKMDLQMHVDGSYYNILDELERSQEN